MSTPNEPTHMFKGTVSGEITTERKGDMDSDMILFLSSRENKTMAELTTEEKAM